MIESDENFNIEDELDHFKHVSAVRAKKIAKLKKQLKDAEIEIKALIALSGGEFNCDEYFNRYKNDNN